MAFEITKTFVVKAPAAAVWEFLIDPHRVARCLPGAAVTDKVDDRTYNGTMTVKVGPVSSSYRGKISFDKLDAAARVAEIAATGQDIKGRGGADLRLKSSVRELGPGESEITAVSTVNITGILAQMGRGMVQDVSDTMFQIFSQRVRAELEGPAAAAATPIAAPAPAAAVAEQTLPAPAAQSPATLSAPNVQPTATQPAPNAEPPAVAQSAAAPPSAPDAQPLAPAAAPAAPVVVAAAAPEALDLGSLGAKVAGRMAVRTLSNPVTWLVALVLAGGLYLLLR